MKGNERKKEKKKGKAESDSPKKLSEYQKGKTSKQDTVLGLKSKP
ncbi:hypothetical protein EZS27_012603 [termite gut metagenome]|jgi:hypothetical protein|uniref:Uncharacterized protein n=1 Tax=termite gut metagenome TaxID=433724 RepID=A0A5J4S061_9ZZZZ